MWRVPWSFPHGFCLKVQEDLDWKCGVCFWCLPKRMTAIDLEVRGMICVEQKFYFIYIVENWKQWDFLEHILVMQNKSSSFWVHQFHFVHLIQLATCLPRRNMHIKKFSQQAPLHSGTGWGSWYLCWQAVRLLSTGGGNTLKICWGMKTSWVFYSKVIDILTTGSKVEKYLCHLVLLSMTSDRLKCELIFGSLQFHDHSQIFLDFMHKTRWVSILRQMFGYAARISVCHPRTLIDGEDSANLPAVGWDTTQAVHAAAQAVMSGVHDCCVLAASWTETYPFVQLGKQCKSCGQYSALDLCRSVTHAMHTRKQRIYDIFSIYNVTIKYSTINQSINRSINQSISFSLSFSLPLPMCIYICILKRHTQTHSQALTLATRWHVQIGAVQDVAKTWRQVRLSFLHTDVLLGGIAGGVEAM